MCIIYLIIGLSTWFTDYPIVGIIFFALATIDLLIDIYVRKIFEINIYFSKKD